VKDFSLVLTQTNKLNLGHLINTMCDMLPRAVGLISPDVQGGVKGINNGDYYSPTVENHLNSVRSIS